MDPPEMLVDGFIENHRKMVAVMKGVPGCIPERLEEAKRIRHCALSLVGEPIIYPAINEFLARLHDNKISSFLVTNAQFPEKIDSLIPVTQLYISVDAATPDALKAIDRPLFSDYWERFLSCIDALARKGQRTVFRLTLVSGWNDDEMQAYAELIKRGRPNFIEIKGVTYCGGKRPELGMKNVPWHEEVVGFGQKLQALISDHYELASEHAHSNCILLADTKFKRGDRWHTWIDFDRFIELADAHARGGPAFGAEDYMEATPEWAEFGKGIDGDGGFDPDEVHVRRGLNAAPEVSSGGC